MTNNEKIRQIEHQLAELEDAPETRIREKIDLLNKLAWLLRDNDAKRSFALCNAAYSLSDGSDGSDQMYQAGIAYSLRTQGFLNMRAADYAEGLTQLHEAQEIFESLSLYDGLADVFFAINGIYFYLGDYPQALEMVYKQMEAAQHIGDRHRIADANNNLAYIYLAVGEQEQGMDLLKRNLPLAQEIKDERIECAIYIKLLQGYLEVGDYQSALEYGFRGLHKSRELGNKQFEMRAHGWLGQYYLGINDKAKTISHLEKALELSRKREAKVFEVLSLINMGQAYREFHQFDQAIEVLNLAEMIGQAISLKLNLFKCHLLQSEIYEELGDSTQALHYYKQYHAVKELVFNGNADQRLKMLQVVHETETAKKEAEIAHLKTIDLQQEIAERKQVELQLQHQLELAHALSTFKETLLAPVSTQHDKHRLLVDALQPLLKHIGASKAYLYENVDHPELGFSSRLIVDAPAPGISSSFDNPDSQSVIIPWSAVPDENRRRLAEGQPVGGLVRNLFAAAPSFRDYLLNEQHVLSVQFFPIQINDTWWGYIGFDDHIHEREWNENDILLLNTAVGIVKSTMQRWWAEDKLRELNQQLEEEVQKQTSELRKTVKLLQKEVNERKRAEAEIQHMV
ncbi:MAG: hypothetical protein KDE48_23420, partial [Anaerolineales bacterium]|nr:hypothetical protein [Anaerolineales bacterium]